MQVTPAGGEGQFRSTSPAKDPREEIWKVMGLLGSLGLPWTALTELGVGCEKLKLPTLSVTGTACVSECAPIEITIGIKYGGDGMRSSCQSRGGKNSMAGAVECDCSPTKGSAIVFEGSRARWNNSGAAGIADTGRKTNRLTRRRRICAAGKRQRR